MVVVVMCATKRCPCYVRGATASRGHATGSRVPSSPAGPERFIDWITFAETRRAANGGV